MPHFHRFPDMGEGGEGFGRAAVPADAFPQGGKTGTFKGFLLDKGDEGGVGGDGGAEAEQGIQHPTGGGKPGEGRQQLEHHEAAADGQVEGRVHPHQGGEEEKQGGEGQGPRQHRPDFRGAAGDLADL